MTDKKQTMRLFMALELDDKARGALVALQAALKRSIPKVSWTKPENLHVTLLFLGDTPYESMPILVESMEQVMQSQHPFEIDVQGLGWFGSSRSSRVLWAGVEEGKEEVKVLCRALYEGLSGRGVPFRPEKRFRPHITLGRVRSLEGLGALTSAVASDTNRMYGRVKVDHVMLMESRLDPHGAVYTKNHTSFLEGV